MSEARILRDRQAWAAAALDRAVDHAPHGSAALLCKTVVDVLYPTAAAVVYALVPVEIDGDESEGASCAYSPEPTNVLYAVNLGLKVPPSGTFLIAHAVGGRWAFRYG